jgi:hypothetical protein
LLVRAAWNLLKKPKSQKLVFVYFYCNPGKHPAGVLEALLDTGHRTQAAGMPGTAATWVAQTGMPAGG